MDATSGSDEKETYVFLDFNGKLPVDVFKKDAFVRLANLQTNNPFVQVNDTVFKGTYDHAMGTNLFFNYDEESSQQTDAFERRGPIKLCYTLANTKVIALKQVKVPPKKIRLPKEMKKIKFNLDQDYNAILEKFRNRTLKPEDIIGSVERSMIEDNEEVVLNEFNDGDEEMKTETISQEVNEAENISYEDESVLNDLPVRNLGEQYEKLKAMALRPMRTEPGPEMMEECDPKYKAAHEYDSLFRQVTKPSDFFRKQPISDIDSKNFSDHVDIDRCVLYGILPKSAKTSRSLTEEEKRKVLTLGNFDNLSLVARFHVLKNQVENLEEDVGSKSESEANERDEYDRTPLQTLEIYRRLRDAVKKRVIEIRSSEDSSED